MSPETLAQIVLTGLTVGAMYALATIGLSLIWGSLGMLNMAHGVLLTIGGYSAYAAVSVAGLPWPMGIAAALLFGGLIGLLLYLGVVRWMVGTANFETNIIIASFGVAIALENSVLQIFGGQPFGQPLVMRGAVDVGLVSIPYQNIIIVVGSAGLMLVASYVMQQTRLGRAIRAVSQQRDAAGLMGVPVQQIFLIVLVFSGMLSAISGVMLTSSTQLAPALGQDPMIKAFIMCVVAGLGHIGGAVAMAFALAMVEAASQFWLGARWGFPVLLTLVILVLIVRPAGLFGRVSITRL